MFDERPQVDQIAFIGFDRVGRRAALELKTGEEVGEFLVVCPHHVVDVRRERGEPFP
jgi:hypothetical protein